MGGRYAETLLTEDLGDPGLSPTRRAARWWCLAVDVGAQFVARHANGQLDLDAALGWNFHPLRHCLNRQTALWGDHVVDQFGQARDAAGSLDCPDQPFRTVFLFVRHALINKARLGSKSSIS